jgi:hypothetical protein
MTEQDRAVLVIKTKEHVRAAGGREPWRAIESRLHGVIDGSYAKQGRLPELLDALSAVARACTKAGINGVETEPILNTAWAILGWGTLQEKDAYWLNAPFCEMWLERRPGQPEPLAVA